MKTLAIWCPTYKRPHMLQKVSDNLKATTKNSYNLYWGLEPDDLEGIDAALKTGDSVVINKYEMGYPNTIQTLYEHSSEPFSIHANDDFEFDQDWDVEALKMFDDPNIMVVGMRQHEGDTHASAISMIRRAYIKDQSGVIDMPNRVFYPYPHHYCDTEFTETAKRRRVWTKCGKLTIHHQHYGFTGAEPDETYKKNDATSKDSEIIYEHRKHLWR